jgi:GTP pyrophosphokinase
MSQDSFSEVAQQLRYEDVTALYAAVGEGHVSTQSVIEKFTALVSANDTTTGPIDLPVIGRSRQPRGGDTGILVRGAPDILVKLAKCCTPVPGDPIVGFVTRGSGVSVHRADCTNVKSLQSEPDRLIDVEWAPTTKGVFLVQIQVEALDRSGLLSDITRVLSEHHVNILSASVQTTNDRLALSRYVFEMGDIVHLDRVLNAVRRIDAVYDVYRVTSS